MNTIQQQQINRTFDFVKTQLQNAEGGHDFQHSLRVRRNALLLMEHEGGNRFIIEMASLLHDVADYKFHDGNEKLGLEISQKLFEQLELEQSDAEKILYIIEHISFKGGIQSQKETFKEFYIVQDADRLDALGAIGIARTFNYGGFKNRPLFDPHIPPIEHSSKASYINSVSPTINHFYEKLLRLHDLMNTPTARRIAKEREDFMKQFLVHFYSEWFGKETKQFEFPES